MKPVNHTICPTHGKMSGMLHACAKSVTKRPYSFSLCRHRTAVIYASLRREVQHYVPLARFVAATCDYMWHFEYIL